MMTHSFRLHDFFFSSADILRAQTLLQRDGEVHWTLLPDGRVQFFDRPDAIDATVADELAADDPVVIDVKTA
jgi:hypothetical protein